MSSERLMLVGDFQTDRLGASYERAFNAIGLAVVRFDVRAEARGLAWPARNRFFYRLTAPILAIRRAWSRKLNLEILERAAATKVAWVFIHNGEWLMPETVVALKRAGVRVAIFHADNPLPPNYSNRPETLQAARECDLYLVWSERLAEQLREQSIPATFHAFGWDPEVFPYQGSVPQGSWSGVVFIGGWDRERESFLDELACHVPLRIFGPGYWGTRTRRSSRARSCWQGRALLMNEAAQVVRESAVSLNVLRTQHQFEGAYDGVIMRHFEVPGAGGFLLSTRSGVATSLFPDGSSGAYFDGVADCVKQCRHFIESTDERYALASAAHETVANVHTYRNRAREVVVKLRSLGSL